MCQQGPKLDRTSEKISKVDRPFSRQIFWTGIADAPAGKHLDDIGKAHIAVTIQVGWTGHRHTGRITEIAARQPPTRRGSGRRRHRGPSPIESHGPAGAMTTAVVPSGRFNNSGMVMVWLGVITNEPGPKPYRGRSAIDFNRGHQLNLF